MTEPTKEQEKARLVLNKTISSARQTTELSLRNRVQREEEDAEPLPTVPNVVRRRTTAGIKAVRKTTELPLE